MHIAGTDSAACLAVIEALSILTGVNSELTENDYGATIRLMGCPFAHTLQFFHPLVCSYYAQGLVKAVNEEAQVKLLNGMCEGDERATDKETVRYFYIAKSRGHLQKY